MSLPPVSIYRQVRIAGWSAATAAGDAAASWQAIAAGRHSLRHEADIGWCGRLAEPAAGCASLAVRVACRAWPGGCAVDPCPALSMSTSKGDPDLLMAALGGRHEAFVASWPGQLQAVVAGSLGWPIHIGLPVAAACASGLYGLLAVADAIEHGRTSSGLAGAVDLALVPLILGGFRNMGVTCGATLPTALRGDGTGFAPAEGGAAIALGHRGPWRLVAGVRLGDAGHETELRHPDVLRALLLGLWSACPHPDLIVVHGTGTGRGDAYEMPVLAESPWGGTPLVAMKPVIGHCLGASGAVELAVALEAPARRVWKIALGFGGHVVAVAVERT